MCKWGNIEHLEYEGKKFQVDSCIAPIVRALNDAGIETVASCCGHGKINGIISLKDGRQLDIYPDFESWEKAKAKEKNVIITN